MAARKPVQDADLTALATLVGAEGMMDVQIFRDVTDGNNPAADWELLDTWPVALDDFKSGAFAMSVGATTGGGLYRFVATKPGSQAKPVEWNIRLSGDPKPPPRVRAERAARQPQAAAYQQSGYPQPGYQQPGFAGAPVSPLPIGGGVPLYGMGAPYGVPYGHGPYGHGSYGHGPYGTGMPPWAQPWSQPWSQPPLVQPQATAAQPAGSDALAKAVDGMTSVFMDVLKTRREEATVPAEIRTEMDRMRNALDDQKRTAAEALARHERELAEAKADAQRARDRAEQQERDARHAQEIVQMRADSDKRFEALQNEMKQSREAAERAAREAADKAKSGPDPTVTAMTESLRLIAKQAEEAGKDARVAMTEAFKAAAARQEHPDWLIQMALQSNAPQAMQQMAAAYGQLFQSTAAMTQAQLAALADQLGEGKEGVVDALREAFGGLVAIGKKIVDRAAEQPTQPLVPALAQQRMRLAGAQQPRALPHGQAQQGAQQGAQPQAGANGTAARTGAPAPVVPLHQRRGLNWGSLSEPHGQLTKAVAEYNLAPEVAAEKIVALVEFSEAFGLAVAPTLIRLAQSNLAELVEVVLPGAPEEYRAKVAAAILAATRDEDEDAPAAGAGAGDAGGAGAAEDAPEDVPEDVPDGNAAGGGDDGDTDGGAPDAPSPA